MVKLYPHVFRLPWHNLKSVIVCGTFAGGAAAIMYGVAAHQEEDLLDNVPAVLLALACALVAVVVWKGLSKPWFFLNSTSFRGYSRSGLPMRLYWHEPVTLAPISDKNFPCLGVQSGPNKQVLVPMAIAKSRKFRAAVEIMAPADHPLRRWVTDKAFREEIGAGQGGQSVPTPPAPPPQT